MEKTLVVYSIKWILLVKIKRCKEYPICFVCGKIYFEKSGILIGKSHSYHQLHAVASMGAVLVPFGTSLKCPSRIINGTNG
jgi:hypothetical protein